MYRPLTLFIGLRYIYGKNTDSFGRFVSWLSMIGLMLGAMALIIVLSVMNGLERDMQGSILRFLPQAQVTTDSHILNPKTYPKTLFTDLRGVESISSLVTGDAVLQSPSSITVSQLMGIDSNQGDPISQFIYIGDLSDLKPGQYHIILGSSLAEQLQVSIGDKVRVMVTNASQLTPLGRIPSQRLFTLVGLFSVNRDINQSLVYVNQADAAKLMRYSGDNISGWRLFLRDPLDIEHVVKQPLPDGLVFKDWREQRGELFAAIKLEKKMMGLLISLIVIVAAFNIITSLGLLVMEKQGEVAILKTQGLTSLRIMGIFVVQGASAGIIGTLLGSILGITIALNLSQVMAYLGLSLSGINLPSLIIPTQVMIIVLSLIAISLLATIYPAWRAAKTQPAEALRYE